MTAETESTEAGLQPAPPTARDPRWTMCQSFAKPSVHEYSHIGETMMRLGSVRLRSAIGVKSMATVRIPPTILLARRSRRG